MRFYLNVCDGHAAVEDRDGSDYPDEDEARQAAIEAARDFLADGDAQGECRRHWHFDVLDADRRRLFQVPFSHALASGVLELGDARC